MYCTKKCAKTSVICWDYNIYAGNDDEQNLFSKQYFHFEYHSLVTFVIGTGTFRPQIIAQHYYMTKKSISEEILPLLFACPESICLMRQLFWEFPDFCSPFPIKWTSQYCTHVQVYHFTYYTLHLLKMYLLTTTFFPKMLC